MSVILCTAGYDHTIRFWEALSGICSRTIQHPDSQVNRLCITPDKRFLAAAGNHNVKLYDIKSTNPNPLLTFEGHTGNVTGVAFHCEGKWMVTSSEDGSVKVWDTRSGSVQRNYMHSSPVNDVVIHPNQGELISCDRSGTIRIWDLGESRCTHQLIPDEGTSMASVSVASDGSLLAAGNNKGQIYIWRMIQNRDVTSLMPVTMFPAHSTYVTRVLLSPDVRHLATCSADHTVKVWQLDAKAIEQQEFHPGDTSTTPKAAANNFKSPADTPSSSSEISTTSSSGSTAVASHPLSSSLSMSNGSNGSVAAASLRHLSPAEQIRRMGLPLETTLANHQRWVWDCAFSADSAYLVTVCSDHYARLWELSTSSIIRQYNGHHRGAVCVALNDYSEPR